jgi:hypothetical protein
MSQAHALRCYQYVNRSYAAVRDALHADPNGIFRRATLGASRRASGVAASLHANIAGIEVGADVTIHVTFSEERSHGPFGAAPMTRLILTWEAARAPALFPAMSAEIRLYPISTKETQLILDGSYEPPLGLLGRAVDALIMHRVAEASVHQFVNDVAQLLSTELAA